MLWYPCQYYMFPCRGADPNCEGPDDQTPLHCAAAQGSRATVKLLLEHNANVRAKDRLL